MSVPEVATTSITLRRLVPRAVAAQPSGVVVRWMLRAVTVVVFAVATLVGVSVGLAAPSATPGSIAEPRR